VNNSLERDSSEKKNPPPLEEITPVLQPENTEKSYFLRGEAGELYNQKLDDAL